MILSAEDLSYSYGDRLLFENITFNVEEGDKYGMQKQKLRKAVHLVSQQSEWYRLCTI